MAAHATALTTVIGCVYQSCEGPYRPVRVGAALGEAGSACRGAWGRWSEPGGMQEWPEAGAVGAQGPRQRCEAQQAVSRAALPLPLAPPQKCAAPSDRCAVICRRCACYSTSILQLYIHGAAGWPAARRDALLASAASRSRCHCCLPRCRLLHCCSRRCCCSQEPPRRTPPQTRRQQQPQGQRQLSSQRQAGRRRQAGSKQKPSGRRAAAEA